LGQKSCFVDLDLSMRILITGGAGFVGSSLALRLRQTCSDAGVVCMDNLYRRGSELIQNIDDWVTSHCAELERL